jgi:hypothetical protein
MGVTDGETQKLTGICFSNALIFLTLCTQGKIGFGLSSSPGQPANAGCGCQQDVLTQDVLRILDRFKGSCEVWSLSLAADRQIFAHHVVGAPGGTHQPFRGCCESQRVKG